MTVYYTSIIFFYVRSFYQTKQKNYTNLEKKLPKPYFSKEPAILVPQYLRKEGNFIRKLPRFKIYT